MSFYFNSFVIKSKLISTVWFFLLVLRMPSTRSKSKEREKKKRACCKISDPSIGAEGLVSVLLIFFFRYFLLIQLKKSNPIVLDETNEEMMCPICLDTLREPAVNLRCNHCFHEECLKAWITDISSCPYCRFEPKKLNTK